jgi:putative transposase
MEEKGRATDIEIIEWWFRTLKQKYIYLNPPQTGLSLFHGVRQFVDKYNNRRHQGINRKKPVELYDRAA